MKREIPLKDTLKLLREGYQKVFQCYIYFSSGEEICSISFIDKEDGDREQFVIRVYQDETWAFNGGYLRVDAGDLGLMLGALTRCRQMMEIIDILPRL